MPPQLAVSPTSTFIDEKVRTLLASKKLGHKDELFVLQLERKTFIEDMEEDSATFNTLEEAYSNVMSSKLQTVVLKPKQLPVPYPRYAVEIFRYYNSTSRENNDRGRRERYCHVTTERQGAKMVKSTKIVPQGMEGSDLSYLLGVQEATLWEPRNALVLINFVGDALRQGRCVIVPESDCDNGSILWRVIGLQVSDSEWYEGRSLKFLTTNRPARRYLYLRYLMTYWHYKIEGNEHIWEEKINSKGLAWNLPGPFVRKSMLLTLGREFPELKLPKQYYEDMSFTTETGTPETTPEMERQMAATLMYKFRRSFEPRRKDYDTSDDSNDYFSGSDHDSIYGSCSDSN